MSDTLSNKLQEIAMQIELLRVEMNRSIREKGSLNQEVLAISKKIDELINQYT